MIRDQSEIRMYNLTEDQKTSLHWIIQKIRDGKLNEEFTCVFLTSGKFARFQGKGDDINEDVPLTKVILYSLEAEKLIFLNRKKEENVFHCGLLGKKAYKAIDSNFKEESNVQVATLPRLFYFLTMVFAMAFSITMVLVVFLITRNLIITVSIIFTALVIFLLIGVFQLRREESLSEKNFMQILELFIKQIPNILGKGLNINEHKNK